MISGVYCIFCKDTNVQQVYVGSCVDLNKRIRDHKKCSNNKNGKEYNKRLYQFIRENGGFDNWKFIWLEMFKTDDTIFLRQLEQNYMDTFPKELLLNSQRAYGQDIERYYEQNIKKCKEYRQQNREIINEKQNQKVPCPKCNKIMNKSSITPHLKKYCKKNTT